MSKAVSKDYTVNSIRNIAVIGHGGSGKTTLTESLMFASGASNRMGRVEDGSTISDYHLDEIERKISINTALTNTDWRGTKINILDTPGYSDFTGEVICALRVADLAVIAVKSAVRMELVGDHRRAHQEAHLAAGHADAELVQPLGIHVVALMDVDAVDAAAHQQRQGDAQCAHDGSDPASGAAIAVAAARAGLDHERSASFNGDAQFVAGETGATSAAESSCTPPTAVRPGRSSPCRPSTRICSAASRSTTSPSPPTVSTAGRSARSWAMPAPTPA